MNGKHMFHKIIGNQEEKPGQEIDHGVQYLISKNPVCKDVPPQDPQESKNKDHANENEQILQFP